MKYNIENATLDDLAQIYLLFEEAIQFQQQNNFIGWSGYDKQFIQSDISNKLLFKLVHDDIIMGIFSICFSDVLIWREKENNDAIYIHRIVLNQKFKGQKIFKKILDWSINFANGRNLKHIRMDTWAENEKIISYYKSYGFSFIENYTTPGTENLPVQHRNLNVALLELNIQETLSNHLDKVNLNSELSKIDDYWTQKIIGVANGQLIKLAKGIGEINWHKHDDQDELFILYAGHLTIQLRSKHIELLPGDMFIVPKGVEHCPIAHEDSSFLIMGLNVTSNTAGGRPVNWTYENYITTRSA